jgi:hypothetical protein
MKFAQQRIEAANMEAFRLSLEGQSDDTRIVMKLKEINLNEISVKVEYRGT